MRTLFDDHSDCPDAMCGACGSTIDECEHCAERCDDCSIFMCDDCSTAGFAIEDPEEQVGTYCPDCIGEPPEMQ